jgi:hypothetical protein
MNVTGKIVQVFYRMAPCLEGWLVAIIQGLMT